MDSGSFLAIYVVIVHRYTTLAFLRVRVKAPTSERDVDDGAVPFDEAKYTYVWI